MPFKVTARTILQLGGELISSDGIAFYELIKNAFDAGSKDVRVDVVVRLPEKAIRDSLSILQDLNGEETIQECDKADAVKRMVAEQAIPSKKLKLWLHKLRQTQTVAELSATIEGANYVSFKDQGDGMSTPDLKNVYLTVGTPHRFNQRKANRDPQKVVLGEKGIGRLSAMRLGQKLQVRTAKQKDKYWNLLRINWNVFGENYDKPLDSIQIVPTRGRLKEAKTKGTSIRISALNAHWTEEKLKGIATTDLSRFTDPFAEKPVFPIYLTYNGKAVPIPSLSKIFRTNAHATVSAELKFVPSSDGGEEAQLTGEVHYLISGATSEKLSGWNQSFCCNATEILSACRTTKEVDPDLDEKTIRNLGPFAMQCYWYNRRLLSKFNMAGDLINVKELVRQWSGGLMVFRDGFRVPPYGGPDDDWLSLDRKALASQGYKVNRAQLVGKVDISSFENPLLVDQTNREGLRDCAEKKALIAILKHILETQFRGYLTNVDNELRVKERISFGALAENLAEVEERINLGLERLEHVCQESPELQIQDVVPQLRSAYQTVVRVVGTMHDSVENAEDERSRLLHLASLGLSIEKLAHELNRATRHALQALNDITTGRDHESRRETAALQLTSLQKRLQNLDPMLSSARQRKTVFDIVDLVEAVLASFEARLSRHKIDYVIENKTNAPVKVSLVQGMVVQILENLIDNAIYWISTSVKKSTTRTITIEIDGEKGQLTVTDTGPGISQANKHRVFEPFFTLKPAGQGKGLGLYISREIAEYHQGSLVLLDKTRDDRLNTFIFEFSVGLRS